MKKFQVLTLYLFILPISISLKASELSMEEDIEEEQAEEHNQMEISLESLFSQARGASTGVGGRKRPHPSQQSLKTYKIYNYHRDQVDKNLYIGELSEDSQFFLKLLKDDKLYKRFTLEVSKPLHYLYIYGPSGTGKKTLAHHIAQTARVKLYELEYHMAPLKIQVSKLMEDLKSLSENAIKNKEKKILLFSGLHPQIPLNDLAENEELKEIFDHFFVITTSQIDASNYEDMVMLEDLDISFLTEVKRADSQQKILIIKSLLNKLTHSLSDPDISSWAKSINSFDGHKIKKVINKAAIIALKNNKNLDIKDIHKARRFSLTSSLTPAHQNLYL